MNSHALFTNIEDLIRYKALRILELLYVSIGNYKAAKKPVGMITLPDGRPAQVFIVVETNPENFVN
jgi:hypothetical protein